MSPTVLIVSGIAVVAVLAFTYVVIHQTATNKKKHQQRILSALRNRTKNLQYMLSRFPENFLPKDLIALINHSLIDTYKQISNLDPSDSSCSGQIQLYTSKLEEAKQSKTAQQRIQISDPQQIKETRTLLQELHKVIEKLLERKAIDTAQAKAGSKQIKNLILQISVDSHLSQARQAQKEKNNRLAAHFYNLAKKLLAEENDQKVYTKQISQLDEILKNLEKQLESEVKKKPDSKNANTGEPNEWDAFEEDQWKKKTVYD